MIQNMSTSAAVLGVRHVVLGSRGSLRSNFTWTLAGNGLHAACSWAMLILLAKLRGPEVVGQYALGVAIVLPMASATSCLRSIVATDARGEYAFSEYLRLRLSLTAL